MNDTEKKYWQEVAVDFCLEDAATTEIYTLSLHDSLPISDEIWGKKLPQGKYAAEYYSARGENCPPRYDQTRDEFLSAGEEFSYIFTSAGWVCYDMNEFNDNQPEMVDIPEGELMV